MSGRGKHRIPRRTARAAASLRRGWGEERRDHQCCEQHAHPRAKGEAPPQRVDEQSQIARVADEPIDTIRDQGVPGLDRDHPLNRRPSTKTAQIRSAPPAAKRTTPSQRAARRPLRARGAAPPAHPRIAGEDRRLHRVRAAAVRTDGDADLFEGPRPPRPDLGARPCSCTPW
jgi:hypothetical protein